MKRMSSLAYHFGVKLRFYPSSKQKKIIKLNYDAQRFVYNSYVGRNRTSYHAKHYLAVRQYQAMPFAFSALNSYETKLAEEVVINNELLSVLSLIELKGNCNEYTSAYPLLIGINNEVKLKEDYCWQNGGEGEFAVEAGDDRVINFFDPFYAINKANFKTDKTQTISLAGLAYSLEKLEEKEFVIDKGEFYNVSRDEFLKENPDKTEKDFEPPVVKLEADHFRMLIPKQYACEYEIATQIENIKYFKILGEEIAQLKVNLEHSDNEKSLYCYIYASKHVLGKYKPQVGDGINAIVWLSGFFN